MTPPSNTGPTTDVPTNNEMAQEAEEGLATDVNHMQVDDDTLSEGAAVSVPAKPKVIDDQRRVYTVQVFYISQAQLTAFPNTYRYELFKQRLHLVREDCEQEAARRGDDNGSIMVHDITGRINPGLPGSSQFETDEVMAGILRAFDDNLIFYDVQNQTVIFM